LKKGYTCGKYVKEDKTTPGKKINNYSIILKEMNN
jgi:hypothetical protein